MLSLFYFLQRFLVSLPENEPTDRFGYEVTVSTGLLPNSGTSSRVSIDIEGDKNKSGPRYLVHRRHPIFRTGDLDSFLLTTEQDLGVPEFIRYLSK